MRSALRVGLQRGLPGLYSPVGQRSMHCDLPTRPSYAGERGHIPLSEDYDLDLFLRSKSYRKFAPDRYALRCSLFPISALVIAT